VDGSYVMKINYNLDNYYLFRPLSGISYLENYIEIIFVRKKFGKEKIILGVSHFSRPTRSRHTGSQFEIVFGTKNGNKMYGTLLESYL